MDYAIIRVGNKQHRVRDGETLVVERVATDEGKTFQPQVLLGDAVTATVVSHERGPKIRIGKYRRRTGYKRHTGFRAATSRIEVSLGAAGRSAAKSAAPKKAAEKQEAAVEAAVEKPPVETAAPAAAEAPATETVVETQAGLPEGYPKLTVAAIADAAKSWSTAELEAALAYEQEHAKRKGALAALESAIAKAGES
jgi:large subunit ribosomal protein L21